jgi:hypothetical protein
MEESTHQAPLVVVARPPLKVLLQMEFHIELIKPVRHVTPFDDGWQPFNWVNSRRPTEKDAHCCRRSALASIAEEIDNSFIFHLLPTHAEEVFNALVEAGVHDGPIHDMRLPTA